MLEIWLIFLYTFLNVFKEIELDPEVALDLLDVLDDEQDLQDMDPKQVQYSTVKYSSWCLISMKVK